MDSVRVGARCVGYLVPEWLRNPLSGGAMAGAVYGVFLRVTEGMPADYSVSPCTPSFFRTFNWLAGQYLRVSLGLPYLGCSGGCLLALWTDQERVSLPRLVKATVQCVVTAGLTTFIESSLINIQPLVITRDDLVFTVILGASLTSVNRALASIGFKKLSGVNTVLMGALGAVAGLYTAQKHFECISIFATYQSLFWCALIGSCASKAGNAVKRYFH